MAIREGKFHLDFCIGILFVQKGKYTQVVSVGDLMRAWER
jgi:hypothetical protein